MEAYQLSDEERVELALINGATKGDNETLGELFDRYQPLVRRLWLNYSIATLDRQDWQQEAFLVLDRAVHNYRQEQRTRFCWYYRQLLTNPGGKADPRPTGSRPQRRKRRDDDPRSGANPRADRNVAGQLPGIFGPVFDKRAGSLPTRE